MYAPSNPPSAIVLTIPHTIPRNPNLGTHLRLRQERGGREERVRRRRKMLSCSEGGTGRVANGMSLLGL